MAREGVPLEPAAYSLPPYSLVWRELGRELPIDGVADPGGVEDESLDEPNVIVSESVSGDCCCCSLRTSCQFQTRQNMPMEEHTQQVTIARRRTPAATQSVGVHSDGLSTRSILFQPSCTLLGRPVNQSHT